MIGSIAAQPTRSTTYETPLRPDLHLAIEARLGASCQQRAAGILGEIGEVVLSVIGRGIGRTAYAARLERDLAGGVCLETVGDVELSRGRDGNSPGEVRVNGLILHLDRQSEREAAATLRALHGATVCYSPAARMLLEIVTADGVLVYRPPELTRARG